MGGRLVVHGRFRQEQHLRTCRGQFYSYRQANTGAGEVKTRV